VRSAGSCNSTAKKYSVAGGDIAEPANLRPFPCEAMADDPARNRAEYLAEFRLDIESFISLDVVEGCVGDYREMLPAARMSYRAFVDSSGGSEDSFTLAISHKDNDQIIIDAMREVKPPFSPAAVVSDFAGLLKTYRIKPRCRRPLRGRISARAIPKAQHHLRPKQEAQVRFVPELLAALELRSRHPTA
jgi:hypothetical protein